MAIISKELAERLNKIEERLENIESALSVLLEWQEDYLKRWEYIDDAAPEEEDAAQG